MSPMFYFFLALTAVLAATANAGPVLDTDGDIIRHGRYYVLPILRGAGGGGVTLSRHGAKPCPLSVVQARSDLQKGIPVIFSNWKLRVAWVPESQNLNIQTDFRYTLCGQNTYWWLDELNPERKNWFLVTGPKPERFGENLFKSYFQIRKAENEHIDAYKIVFCPGNCIDVGIFPDENGVWRLALSNQPLFVRFMKANGTTTVDSSETM